MTFQKFKTGFSLMMLPILINMTIIIGSGIHNNNDANKTRKNINDTYQKSLSEKLKPVDIDVVNVTNSNDSFTIVGKNQDEKIVTYQLDKLPTIDNQKIKGYYTNSRIYSSPKQYKNRIKKLHDFSIKTLNSNNQTDIIADTVLIVIEIIGLIAIFIINLKLAENEAKTKELLKED